MSESSYAPICSAQSWDGDPCEQPCNEDAPYPVCETHLMYGYRYVNQTFLDEETGVRDWPVREPGPVGVVYYVRVGDQVKIGTTTMALDVRFQMLPPDRHLLATEPGGRDVERIRHLQFKHLRVVHNREWFRAGPDLWDHVRDLRERHGDPTSDPRVANRG